MLTKFAGFLIPPRLKSKQEHEADLKGLDRAACKKLSSGNIRLQLGKCSTSVELREQKQIVLDHKY